MGKSLGKDPTSPFTFRLLVTKDLEESYWKKRLEVQPEIMVQKWDQKSESQVT